VDVDAAPPPTERVGEREEDKEDVSEERGFGFTTRSGRLGAEVVLKLS